MARSLKEIPKRIKDGIKTLSADLKKRKDVALQRKEAARLEQIKRQLNLTPKEIIAIVEEARYALPYPGRQNLLDAVEKRMLPNQIQWSDVRKIAQNELSKMLDLSDDEVVAVVVSARRGKLSLPLQSNFNQVEIRFESLNLLWPDVVRTAEIAMEQRNLQVRINALTLQN